MTEHPEVFNIKVKFKQIKIKEVAEIVCIFLNGVVFLGHTINKF